MGSVFEAAAGAVRPLDEAAMAEARARQDRLTKPRGALGRLEELSVQLAVEEAVETERLPDVTLKGFHKPVPVYNVLALKADEMAASQESVEVNTAP